MLFNGVNLKDYLTINKIQGRGILSHEINTVEAPGVDGSMYEGKHLPPRYIDVEFTIQATNAGELREKIDELNEILDVEVPVPIVFDDEPDKTYYGVPESTSENSEFVRHHQGSITFFCTDPYKYGEEKEEVFPSDIVTVENSGSADADPIFELEARQPATFAMIQNQDEDYILVGRPVEVGSTEPFTPMNRIFYTSALSLTGWTEAAPGEVDGVITGEMQASGGQFNASDYGTGSGWHGPAMKTSLPETLTDFRLSAWISFRNKAKASRVGRMEVYLLDANGRQVCKVSMQDVSYGQANALGQVRVGEIDAERTWHNLIYEYGNKPGTWNDFSGQLRVERRGNEWSAYIAKVNVNTGVHSHRRIASWTDTRNRHNSPIAQVVVHVAAYGSHEPVAGGITAVGVYRINNPQDYEIPYIVDEGDIITFDHKDEEIYINGEPRKDLKDFGSSYFKLAKGTNQLIVFPEETFNAKVRFRERFK